MGVVTYIDQSVLLLSFLLVDVRSQLLHHMVLTIIGIKTYLKNFKYMKVLLRLTMIFW